MAGKPLVVITGGARGIGRTLAEAWVADGARVALADLDLEQAEATAAELGQDVARGVRCDVGDDASVQSAMEEIASWAGRIDCLVNNAGLHLMAWSRPATEIDSAGWMSILSVNVVGLVRCARSARPWLAESPNASIINVSSVSGIAPRDVYGVTKLAVRGVTTALAAELAADGIRVNCVAPGPMDTDSAMADLPPALLEDFISTKQLIGRQGRTADLVGPALFLASEAAAFVTGETLVVGGGFPLRI
ncbi:SDR family NAD(P)-dependent oxidoreductase [Actinomadura sp. 3N508]|uniref:SDR family NAD(P)-dependent oxidoreductase n=1 Tax=Actinomadura sp. 3N508 TaxID=3375153 RepID=UPI00378801C8